MDIAAPPEDVVSVIQGLPRSAATRLTSGLHFPHRRLILAPQIALEHRRREATQGTATLRYLFEEYAFDTSLRELHRGAEVVSVAPQVFDLLDYLIRNRERVVSKDDLIN